MAQGVPRPDGLPPGAPRDLVHALHDLYQDAGMPSMRNISRAIRDRDDLRDTVSHETIGQMLRGESTPGWAKFDCVVRYLVSVAVHRVDLDATVARFHELWLAAVGNKSPASHVSATTPEPASTPKPPGADVIQNLPPRNPRFVGREHHLRTIHEVLRTGSQLLALHGVGGVGKTQLAIEYAYHYREHYDLVWWISAGHTSQLRASLAELAARLTLSRSRASQHPPSLVLDALRENTTRWLLLFDNARTPGTLPLLADLGTGRVLITSRGSDWSRLGSGLEVGVFEREESVRLLRDRAPDLAIAEADQLAERLGDLPLAVEQAAGWHLASGVRVADYLEKFDSRMRKIRSDPRARKASYPLVLVGFLQVVLEEFERLPAAAQLLELFAWLGTEPLSLTLLRSGRRAEVTAPLRAALHEPAALNLEIRHLRQRGLVTVFDGNPIRIHVHRDIQQAMREWLGDARLARGRANVQAILAAANPGEPDDSRFWGHYAEVGPHLMNADLVTATDFEVRRVALDQVRYKFRIGHYEQSIVLGEQLVNHSVQPSQEASDTDHHFFILARHQLANSMRMVGRYAEARKLTLDALDYIDLHPELDPHDEYVASLDRNRAADLRIAGRYAEALVVDEAGLGKQTRVDADDADTIRTMQNNIAVDYRLLGRFTKALATDDGIVQEWTDAKGVRDPRTLFARTNLARDLYGLGRYVEALDEVRAVLPEYRKVVGDSHHGVLLAVRTEVMALRKLGEYAAALDLAERNYHDFSVWFGASHEYTLAASISLMNARLAAADLGIATVETPRLLDACEELFGAAHPMTLAAVVDSASLLRALGDVHGAQRRDEQAAGQLERLLGSEHPYTLCANHNLIVDLALLDRTDEAMSRARSALAHSTSSRGEDHPDTLACAVNVALHLGDVTAFPTVGHAAESWEEQLGTAHPQVRTARAGRWIECDIEPPPT